MGQELRPVIVGELQEASKLCRVNYMIEQHVRGGGRGRGVGGTFGTMSIDQKKKVMREHEPRQRFLPTKRP